jgi:hypothetical protein
MFAITNSSARAFPDGRQAVAFGESIPVHASGGTHLYAIDLESGKLRPLETGAPIARTDYGLAVTRDGKSVLAALGSGNLERIVSVPISGRGPVRPLLSLTSAVFDVDAGPDGSIYLDQVERPVHLLRFSAQEGRVERIANLPGYEAPGAPWNADENFAVLPDGRVVLTQGTGGRPRLVVVEAGKNPVPVVATAEATSAPVTAAGPGEIAFLIGPEPRRTIAMAALSNGRVTRRIPFDKGSISALASSSDGKILYCAAGGNIWSIPVMGGEPKKLRAGDYVAVDPSGAALLVEVYENPVIRLIQVPLNGAPEREVPRNGPLRPAFQISPNAVGRDGRILMPLGTSTWYWPPGVIDPRTGEVTRIPVDFTSDIHALGWAPDGKVMALSLGFNSRIWKFTSSDISSAPSAPSSPRP